MYGFEKKQGSNLLSFIYIEEPKYTNNLISDYSLCLVQKLQGHTKTKNLRQQRERRSGSLIRRRWGTLHLLKVTFWGPLIYTIILKTTILGITFHQGGALIPETDRACIVQMSIPRYMLVPEIYYYKGSSIRYQSQGEEAKDSSTLIPSGLLIRCRYSAIDSYKRTFFCKDSHS